MHANCYAAFNKNWVGLQSCSCFESGFAGPQSRDFKRWLNFSGIVALILLEFLRKPDLMRKWIRIS